MQQHLTLQQILAPIRTHARRSPDERLDMEAGQILLDMVRHLDGADRRAEAHVASTLEVLAPRLYDLWDIAGAIQPCPRWLAPLAAYARPRGMLS